MTTPTMTMTVKQLTERERFMLLRRRLGIRQGELAREVGMGVTQSRLSGWERDVNELTSEQIQALWEALVRRAAAAAE